MSDQAPKREINLSKERVQIEIVDAEKRKHSFDEFVKSYPTLELAKEEAKRCLRCPKKPCSTACPLGNDIPKFIAAIENGDIDLAQKLIFAKSALPAVCSRVCPQEKQCEGACTRGRNGESVNIGALERFAVQNLCAQNSVTQNCVTENKLTEEKKVAIVGAGPAGLSAADFLSRAGIKVTVFEKRHFAGGVLESGIPKFRLPKNIVRAKTEELQKRGVEFIFNSEIGAENNPNLNQLVNEFNAVFLASGADKPKSANLQNENTDGVIQAKDFLEQINFSSDCANLMLDEDVIVVGGGNVAMDVAACATRAGAQKVTIVYRRSIEELPARVEEIKLNEEEGVVYHLLASPVAITTQNQNGLSVVKGLQVQKVELGEPDETGRRTPVCKVGSDYEIPCTKVIVAIGSDVDKTSFQSSNLETDQLGKIIVDETFRTNNPKIWAGGDLVTGPLTVVGAVHAGREAASSILSVL